MFRLDRESNIIWHNTDHIYHHTMNLGVDGNIWATSKSVLYSEELNERAVKYWDNEIVKIDVNTGKVLYKKSISEILHQKGYAYLIHGMGNKVYPCGNDPLHLNDIEPALEDGQYWQTNDLFLSFRNRSLIMQYRPATDEIIRLIHGPFLNQHDVDIISDSKISLFNNNVSSLRYHSSTGKELATFSRDHYYSEIVTYDFSDSSFSNIYLDQFKENEIHTSSQGLHHLLSNGDVFVESQNNGIIYILNNEKVLLRKYGNDPVNDLIEPTHWTRIYENIDF